MASKAQMKKKKTKKLNKKGFTLIELLICVAVMAVLSVYLIEMVSVTSSLYKRQTSKSEIQDKAAVVLNSVGDVFKNAKTIAVNDGTDVLTINSYDSKDTRTKIYYDKKTEKLYICYECESEDKPIFFANYLLQDGVKDFTVERSAQYSESGKLAEGNLSVKVSVTLSRLKQTYTESAFAAIRNSDTYIGFDVDGGWISLPTQSQE